MHRRDLQTPTSMTSKGWNILYPQMHNPTLTWCTHSLMTLHPNYAAPKWCQKTSLPRRTPQISAGKFTWHTPFAKHLTVRTVHPCSEMASPFPSTCTYNLWLYLHTNESLCDSLGYCTYTLCAYTKVPTALVSKNRTQQHEVRTIQVLKLVCSFVLLFSLYLSHT